MSIENATIYLYLPIFASWTAIGKKDDNSILPSVYHQAGSHHRLKGQIRVSWTSG